MSASAQLAKGITVTFSNFSGDLIDADFINLTRPGVDVTHQGSGNYREMLAGAFIENKPVNLTISYYGTINVETIMTTGTSTLLITYPVPSGLTNGASHSVSAFCSNAKVTGKLGDKITGEFEFTPTGAPTFSVAS